MRAIAALGSTLVTVWPGSFANVRFYIAPIPGGEESAALPAALMTGSAGDSPARVSNCFRRDVTMTKRFLGRKLFSWLLTCAAAISFAAQAAGQTASSPNRLQALVNDVAVQFQLAYRANPAERQRSHEQLAVVVESWRTARRSEANDARLAEWLRAAMRSSMPGSRTGLPPMPAFERSTFEPRSTAPSAINTSMPTPADKSTGDPFVDDPIAE